MLYIWEQKADNINDVFTQFLRCHGSIKGVLKTIIDKITTNREILTERKRKLISKRFSKNAIFSLVLLLSEQ